jgi:hypothetical protein
MNLSSCPHYWLLLARIQSWPNGAVGESRSTAGRWGDALSQKFLYVITDLTNSERCPAQSRIRFPPAERQIQSRPGARQPSRGWFMSPRARRFGNLHQPSKRTVLERAVWAWGACRWHRPRPGHVKFRCACRCRSPATREDVPTC